MPPDEDIALEGLERAGRCKALSQTVWDFHIEVAETAEAEERERVSLRLWPARLDQCNLGQEMQFWPPITWSIRCQDWSLSHTEVTTATKQNDFVDNQVPPKNQRRWERWQRMAEGNDGAA